MNKDKDHKAAMDIVLKNIFEPIDDIAQYHMDQFLGMYKHIVQLLPVSESSISDDVINYGYKKFLTLNLDAITKAHSQLTNRYILPVNKEAANEDPATRILI